MILRFTLALALLPAAAFAAQRIDVTTVEKADFAPGGTLRVEGSTGELNVEGWDQPSVEIEVVRYTWADAKDAAKAKADLGLVQVSKKIEGQVLTLTTTHKRYTHAHVDYRIRVPRNTKLVIRHGIGDVLVFGVEGDIEASAKVGDVTLQLKDPGKYQIDAFSKTGAVYSDFEGTVRHRRMGLGESMNPAAEGTGELRHVTLHVGTGGISIQKVAV